MSERAAGIAAACGAVIMFSFAGALVAAAPASGLAAMVLISAGSGVALIAWSYVSGEDRSRVPFGAVAWLAVLNLAQGALYFVALKLAPTGPAAALHLAAPVILMLWALAKRTRSLGVHEIVTLLLVVCGLTLAAAGTSTPAASGRGAAQAAVGLTLALLSAVAVAAMLALVARSASTMSLQLCNGIKSLAGAAALAPVLLLSPAPDAAVAAQLLAVGALVAAPGLALIWFAAARAPTTTVATIGLFEAALTPLIAAWLGVSARGGDWLIVAPIVAAALIEIVHTPHQPPTSGGSGKAARRMTGRPPGVDRLTTSSMMRS